MKDLETDKAAGSESGVDDHAMKFPLLCESAVCTWVATCWCGFEERSNVEFMPAAGNTWTDADWYAAMADGEAAKSLSKEPESSVSPTCNVGWASMWG